MTTVRRDGRPTTGTIRLAVLDDEAFVRTPAGAHHPVAATFHRFVEAVVRQGPFGRARYIVPIRRLRPDEPAPPLGPIDESVLDVVPTAPFRGIADYVVRAGVLSLANWTQIERAIAASDLVWLRLPASNALLALAACRLNRVPHFGWVAGSVREVVHGQDRSPANAMTARAVARAYDAVTELAGRNGPLVRLDGTMFTSVVTDEDLAAADGARPAQPPSACRIVWAGRMAPEKGLLDLLEAVRLVSEAGVEVELSLIGDGPERPRVAAAADAIAGMRVSFHGYVAERWRYFELLRAGDVFANPSRAEGVPKTLVEAMAAGLPVVATAVGGVTDLLDGGRRGRLVRPGDYRGMAAEIRRLLADAPLREDLRERGLAYARAHTAQAQARRLVAWLQTQFPDLAWAG